MWIGSIRLDVATKDADYAGTDSLVEAILERDGNELVRLELDYSDEDDLERGAFRGYYYNQLPWINHETPKLPDGIGQDPMPYPSYGIEFSHGLNGHLKLTLHINGDDMWIKDNVDLYIREVGEVATSFDTVAWEESTSWQYIGTWSRDVALSTDSSEGVTDWNLVLI